MAKKSKAQKKQASSVIEQKVVQERSKGSNNVCNIQFN